MSNSFPISKCICLIPKLEQYDIVRAGLVVDLQIAKKVFSQNKNKLCSMTCGGILQVEQHETNRISKAFPSELGGGRTPF